ncbi:hypothetical protein IAQ61_005481 [Plenodomus lingam]|uniref:uncharacterized protein n=1 Tax=Leptosphaeria maculans TaxID=5022 RepID=UPI00332C9151|nr:hypothetical protein IAQ61_005481 [Plenodomus lingam]
MAQSSQSAVEPRSSHNVKFGRSRSVTRTIHGEKISLFAEFQQYRHGLHHRGSSSEPAPMRAPSHHFSQSPGGRPKSGKSGAKHRISQNNGRLDSKRSISKLNRPVE